MDSVDEIGADDYWSIRTGNEDLGLLNQKNKKKIVPWNNRRLTTLLFNTSLVSPRVGKSTSGEGPRTETETYES